MPNTKKTVASLQNTPPSESQILQAKKVAAQCATWDQAREKIAQVLERHPDTITRLRRRLAKKGVTLWQPAQDSVVVAETRSGDEERAVEIQTTKRATLDDVIEMCQIDGGAWESKGFNVRQTKDGYAWSARFARKSGRTDWSSVLNEFARRANSHSPNFEGVKTVKSSPKGRLLELSIPDLHLAKLCWAQETGHKDYDIKIAAELYRRAVDSIVNAAQGMGVERILLPIGNDFLNSDNAAGTTTAGTPQAQSEDSRWKKAFMTACDLVAETVEALAVNHKVDVVVVAGNHDNERCFYLGQYIKSWFRNHPNVTVDNSPTQRKYYHFGATLFGFTHGNEEKPSILPGIMANECKALWAQTKFREWHLGHEHREMLREELGVKIRHLPSLCPPDEWMASKGYIGNDQAAVGMVFDLDQGIIASLYFRA